MDLFNYKDGSIKIRTKPSHDSDIVGIITAGQKFKYYPNDTTDWWGVDFKYLEGYIHRSRIIPYNYIKDDLEKFYIDFYNLDKNNVEINQEYNEKLFLLTQLFPSATLDVFCKQDKKVQDFLLFEYSFPIHDLINLEVIYSKLIYSCSSCQENEKILSAIVQAGQKIQKDIKVDNFKTYHLPDYNNPSLEPSTKNRWFIDTINELPTTFFLQHPYIDYYSKMFYQGQFSVSDDSITFSIMDSLLTKDLSTRVFYQFNFNSILRITDGALSEVIGDYSKSFFESFPCSFLEIQEDDIYKDNHEKWINFTALGYYFCQEPIIEINNKVDSLIPHIKTYCPTRLNDFISLRDKLIKEVKNLD
jgi:hypothetical protein